MEVCDKPNTVTENDNATAFPGRNATYLPFAGQNTSSNLSNMVLEDDMSHKIFVAVMTSLLAFVILIGNGLIIVSVTVVRKLRQPANYLIVSLAFSDFLVALVVLPLTITYDILGEWVFGSTICNIHVGFDVICCTTSIMNLCMISIDRYLMITKPMTYPKQRTAKLMALMITTAWVISCLIIIPALFGFTSNVTDDPTWIHLGPTSGFRNESSNVSVFIDWTPISNNLPNPSPSYWTQCQSTPNLWQFAVDLERDYDVKKFRLERGNASTSRFKIQALAFGGKYDVLSFDLNFTSSTVLEMSDVTARYLRILLNESYPADVIHTDASLEIFAELKSGKTCLISQEVWFTIYSTVGAFYIPLAVMLCMYWKIYAEASRFKARHRARSRSLSEPLPSPKTRRRSKLKRPTKLSSPELPLVTRPICETKIKLLDVSDAGYSSTVVIDELTSGNCDDVFDSKLESIFCRDGGSSPQNGVSRDVISQDSGSSHCNGEKFEHEGLVSYELNGNTLGNYREKNGRHNSAPWCQTLHYSAASMKSVSPSFINHTESVDHFQCNGQKDEHDRKRSEVTIKSERSRIYQSPKYAHTSRASIFSTRRTESTCSSMIKAKRRGSIFSSRLTRRTSSSSTRERLRNVKAIRTLGIIVFVFTFCWLPFFILTFIRPFVCENPESQDCFPMWLVRLVLWLGYLNSALNPIIYVGFSPDLRETFKFLICCKCTNVDRRLARIELLHAIECERRASDTETNEHAGTTT